MKSAREKEREREKGRGGGEAFSREISWQSCALLKAGRIQKLLLLITKGIARLPTYVYAYIEVRITQKVTVCDEREERKRVKGVGKAARLGILLEFSK